jgi:hypothetical protein
MAVGSAYQNPTEKDGGEVLKVHEITDQDRLDIKLYEARGRSRSMSCSLGFREDPELGVPNWLRRKHEPDAFDWGKLPNTPSESRG